MKTVKVISAFCAVVLLTIFQNLEVFAQENADLNQAKVSSTQTKKKAETDKIADSDELSERDKTNSRYLLGYQDTVEIVVFKHPEFSQTIGINPDGTIFLPRIDQPIVAVCKTEYELKQTIENLYKLYLQKPFVTVKAIDQRSQSVAVIGAVEKPGNFYLNRRIRLLELLAFAGGQDVEKSGSEIQIARSRSFSGCEKNVDVAAADDQVQFIRYNMNEVLSGKQNPWMQPGDIVTVLDAEQAYVVGNVFKPVKISLKEPKTLTQAIAEAGGLDATAKTEKIVIQRQARDGINKTELAYNIKDIRDKKIPDPQLQANDIVEVSNDKVKTVRNGLLKAITGGLGNVFYRFP